MLLYAQAAAGPEYEYPACLYRAHRLGMINQNAAGNEERTEQ